MTNPQEPNWQWRLAARFDIGRLARFKDYFGDEYQYGILTEVYIGQDKTVIYFSDISKTGFDHCEVQYDINQSPHD